MLGISKSPKLAQTFKLLIKTPSFVTLKPKRELTFGGMMETQTKSYNQKL